MKKLKFVYLLIALTGLANTTSFAGELIKFSIQVTNKTQKMPVSVSLENIPYNNSQGSPVLYEIKDGNSVPIPSQVEPGTVPLLWFIPGEGEEFRNYILRMEDHMPDEIEAVSITKDKTDYLFSINGRPVLKYRYAINPVPDSLSPLYARSGYIHPLYSPRGQVLTQIRPPDHLHHYGVWGPWTKTFIEGREVDFWNLGKGQGTVSFMDILSRVEGPVFSSIKVLQHHIDFGATGEDSLAIREILEIRVWNTPGNYMVDYISHFSTPLKNGVELAAYRYGGGLSFRAPAQWDKNGCTVLSSDGKTRNEADGTKAQWCRIEGTTNAEEKVSGILFISHPTNRNHPEPMRVWPDDAAGGTGELMFNFTPTRHHPWKLKKGNEYSLRYRLIMYDGKMTEKEAREYGRKWTIYDGI